jgi:hypothetical protein
MFELKTINIAAARPRHMTQRAFRTRVGDEVIAVMELDGAE